MATFRKRGPSQWQVQIRRKGYPIQSKTFNTRARAERWARAIESEMDSGTFVSRAEAESTTLGQLLDRYLAEVTPHKKGAQSEADRVRMLQRHPIAARIVAGIRGPDIARWRDERLRQVMPGTVKRDLSLLGHLFEVARKEWGFPVPNPVRDIKMPSGGRPRERRLQAGEEARLFAACREARNAWLLPIVQLALETAMRRGEMLSLRWQYVDLDRRVAYLPDTKNGDARSVPLSSAALAALRAVPRDRHGDVFAGVTAEAVKLSYARAVRRAALHDLRFHDLRHEATTRLFEKGLNIMEVATITGHKDLRMLRRYTHLKAEDLARRLG